MICLAPELYHNLSASSPKKKKKNLLTIQSCLYSWECVQQHEGYKLIEQIDIPSALIEPQQKMNLLSLLLNEGSGEEDVNEDLVHLKGVPSSQTENMLLSSHLILICLGERRRAAAAAAAPCCPLANCELFSENQALMPSFSHCLFHNLTWLVFITHTPHTHTSLSSSLPSSINCGLTTIMHPPVGQLNPSYLPEQRGQRQREKQEEIKMSDLLLPPFSTPAPLEARRRGSDTPL